METTCMVKSERKDRRKLRSNSIVSRMIGMYRLMNEELSYNATKLTLDDPITTAVGTSKKDWNEFRSIVFDELYDHVTSPSAVAEIEKRRVRKDTGSLGDLLFSDFHFPKQAISIRVGNVMEHACDRFLATKGEDVREELLPAIRAFCDKGIQLDIANKYNNTVLVAELKYNFTLDTGKTTSVSDKIDTLSIFLKDRYKNTGLDTAMWFVSLRYPTVDQIPDMKAEFEAIRRLYVLGYQEFFSFYGMIVTEAMWARLHRDMEKEIKLVF